MVPAWCTGESGGCLLQPGDECTILEERRALICGEGISVVDPRTNLPVDVELERAERKVARAKPGRAIPPAHK